MLMSLSRSDIFKNLKCQIFQRRLYAFLSPRWNLRHTCVLQLHSIIAICFLVIINFANHVALATIGFCQPAHKVCKIYFPQTVLSRYSENKCACNETLFLIPLIMQMLFFIRLRTAHKQCHYMDLETRLSREAINYRSRPNTYAAVIAFADEY